jgi:FAD/FMN-containing dehydrogenase
VPPNSGKLNETQTHHDDVTVTSGPGVIARIGSASGGVTTFKPDAKEILVVTETKSLLSTRIESPLAGELTNFRSRLAGTVLTAADEGYDTARGSMSMMEDRRPRIIVQAADEQDVSLAIQFATSNGLHLAIRSGGHGLASHATIDDSLLIDFSHMKSVIVDPVARTARVQPGATSETVAAVAHEHGLALTTGDTQSVGIGGLATGGGIGFMVRAFGLTIDNMLSARVVTADGSILVASPIEHPDLFWAIRGGGGNFGVVTEFTFRMAPVDTILGGVLVLPATKEVLRGYLDYSVAAPDDLTTIGNVMHCPPAPFIPAEYVGQPVFVMLTCWTGSPAEGELALAPFRALATPIADFMSVMPYPAIYKFTEQQTMPHAASVRMMFADDLSDNAIDSILGAVENATSPFSIIQVRGLGGAMARVDPYATAFQHRDQRYFVATLGLWIDPTDDGAAHIAWTKETFAAIHGEGRGAYVNFLQDEGQDRIREAYGETTMNRLAQIKHFYDPSNVFQHGQNIHPKA